jgi:multiple sugar transport system ATP-binding protein
MRLELVRLHRELQTTMIYVTHDQVEAMTMADRIYVLNLGRVEQVASPLELYQHPASLFVAGFIGAPKMNFFEVRVQQAEENRCTVALFQGTALSVPGAGKGIAAGDTLTLGIRPEHVTLAPEGDVQGEIQALEHLGPRTYVHARLADGNRLVTQTAGDTTIREGDRLAFRFAAECCHLFDASGKRLRT